MKLIDYYGKLGISKDMLLSLNEELRLPNFTNFQELTRSRHEIRLESLNEMKGDKWPYNIRMSGKEIDNELSLSVHKWKRKINILYEFGDYKVGFARPGKEAAIDYKGINHYPYCEGDCCKDGKTLSANNPPDVFPLILKNNSLVSIRKRSYKTKDETKSVGWNFERVFKGFELDGKLSSNSSEFIFGMEILGAILYRAAFMLDHKKQENKGWRLVLPRDSFRNLKSRISYLPVQDFLNYDGSTRTHDVPIDVMIYFLDILSINEDVKVDTKGIKNLMKKGKPQDNGRTNTHLTYCNLVATILGRVAIGDFSYQFQRKAGMADLSKSKGESIFPLLSRNLKLDLNNDISQFDWFKNH